MARESEAESPVRYEYRTTWEVETDTDAFGKSTVWEAMERVHARFADAERHHASLSVLASVRNVGPIEMRTIMVSAWSVPPSL